MFAGLMDVQDRMIWNRSYTTGHKAYRQRSLIELGRAIGWEHARHVIYAAVPDLAVGPRWYSSFEAACQIMLNELEEEAPESTLAATVATDTDRRLFANTTPVSQPEAEALIHAILRGDETHFIEPLVGLLRAGRSPRSILDAIQIASARVLLETRAPHAFTMPHHTMEYCNMVAWFYDHFDHPHRTKLLFVVANFINQAARHIRSADAMIGMDGVPNGPRKAMPPKGSDQLSGPQILRRLESALLATEMDASVDWTQAYLDGDHDRDALVQTLAVAAAKHGNDPHNQEIGLCILQDYRRTSSPMRDTLLLASAQNTAGAIKYGDQFALLRQYGEAFGVATEAESDGGDDPADAFLDDIEVEVVPGVAADS